MTYVQEGQHEAGAAFVGRLPHDLLHHLAAADIDEAADHRHHSGAMLEL
jgi:hypothetical protein